MSYLGRTSSVTDLHQACLMRGETEPQEAGHTLSWWQRQMGPPPPHLPWDASQCPSLCYLKPPDLSVGVVIPRSSPIPIRTQAQRLLFVLQTPCCDVEETGWHLQTWTR